MVFDYYSHRFSCFGYYVYSELLRLGEHYLN